MDENESKLLSSFISYRQIIAENRLECRPRYLANAEKHENSYELVKQILEHNLSADDAGILTKYFEDERGLRCDKMDEMYLQGLRDSFIFYRLLGIFGEEIGI